MRRALLMFIITVSVGLAPSPALAMLVTLGEINKTGLWDENPLHVALLMEAESRPDLISEDGGITWKISADKLSPEKLRPLPQDGQVQYRFAQTPEREGAAEPSDQRLIGSKDGGQTWSDISPWRFLTSQLGNRIEKRKSAYLAKYGHWLPPMDESWPLVFSISTGCLLLPCGWVLWRKKQMVLSPLLLSAVCCLVGGIAFFATHAFGIYLFATAEWEGMWVWTSGTVQFPRWPTGLVMHLTGNVWLAPLAAIVCFGSSPLTFALAGALPRWRTTLHAFGITIAIVVVLLAAGVVFYGQGSIGLWEL